MSILITPVLLAGFLGLFMVEMKEVNVDKGHGPGSANAAITIIRKWNMPKELTEISGLSYIDDKRFACVQDELGKIFIYNIASSSVEKEIPFGTTGDYEGLAVVGETVWVLRADGKLYEVSNINTTKPSVKEHTTHLTMKQDSEGLCFDKKNNRLLIAIKGAELSTEDYKGIYAFDLVTKKMDQKPVFKIDLMNKVFESNGTGKKKKGSINPSGIAIQPINGDMYITDGRNAKLLITDAAGKIKSLYQLNTNEFAQPEGISFNAAGDLFIANEGTKQPGNILQVKIDR
jgi:DNA-binding beta-propeller fold protein YncE